MIEVMACPGGCIGGGGQPYPPEGVKVLDPELLRQRAAALYSHRQRQDAPQVATRTRPSKSSTTSSWAGRDTEKAHAAAAHPLPRQTAPRHPMSTMQPPTTGKQVQAAGQGRAGRADRRSTSTQCRQRPAAGQPADRRPAQGAGPLRLPRPGSSWTPWPSCCKCRPPRWPAWPASTTSSACSPAAST